MSCKDTQIGFWLPVLKDREENLVAMDIAEAETDLLVLHGFLILGH